eukprot:2917784-Prymnesium_polylepis.1
MQTFGDNGRIEYAQRCVVVGPPSKIERDGNARLSMYFPGVAGFVVVRCDQLSRSLPPPLPGGNKVGDEVYYLGCNATLMPGAHVTHGGKGQVVGPQFGDDTRVAVLFPGNTESIACRVSELTPNAPPWSFPGGYHLGDRVFHIGESETFPGEGKGALYGEQGVVGGMTNDSYLCATFPSCGRDEYSVACLSRTAPPPLPGNYSVGDRVTDCRNGKQGEVVGAASNRENVLVRFPGEMLSVQFPLRFLCLMSDSSQESSTTWEMQHIAGMLAATSGGSQAFREANPVVVSEEARADAALQSAMDASDLDALRATIAEQGEHASAGILQQARRMRERLKVKARKVASRHRQREHGRLCKTADEAVAAPKDAEHKETEESSEDESKLCVVCLSRERTHIFVPCGHQCVCQIVDAAMSRCFGLGMWPHLHSCGYWRRFCASLRSKARAALARGTHDTKRPWLDVLGFLGSACRAIDRDISYYTIMLYPLTALSH